ncbi:efflux RND transporter permease subunit [Glutamicibacter sp. X7]
MQRLAVLSLKNRALIALVTVFVGIFGVISMGSLKQELIPSLEFPQIAVVASQPGASPEVIDQQVAQPLESALQAVEGLESSNAVSSTGFTSISLTLAYGTDMDRARSQVDKALSNAKNALPEDVEPSSFTGSVADIPIVYLAVSSDKKLEELRDDVERIVVPKLNKIDGVREADVSGGTSQFISVLPDQQKLAAAQLTAADLKDAIENSGAQLPVGTVEADKLSLPVISGSAPDSLEKIRQIPVTIEGKAPKLLKDLAKVDIKADTATSITRTNGVETLALSVTKTPDGDTVGISHAVAEQIGQWQQELGSNAKITTVFDQAPFIEQSIEQLTVEGMLGLGFAIVVILIFLFSLRSTLVTAISIPLSLLVTFIGMNVSGYTLNMLTLGALTISIGRVVDDSIVVIENIKRHLSYGESKKQAILLAVREVAGAITAATLTTVAVFLPVALVSGLAGELFRPFALTMTIALLASLVVSLSIVPVLAYWFLPHRPQSATTHTAHIAEERGLLQRGYTPVLRSTQRHPVITLIASVLILGGTVAMTPLLDANLLGNSGENSMRVTQSMPSGTSLNTTVEQAEKVEKALMDTEGVQDVQLTVGQPGGSLSSRFASGADQASFTVITDPEADQVVLQNRVRTAIDDLGLPSDQQVTVGASNSMVGDDVTVEVSAPDEDVLADATKRVREQLRDVPQVTEVEDNLSAKREQVTIDIDAQKAAEAGLTESQLSGIIAAQVSPIPAGSLRVGFTDLQVKIGEGEELRNEKDLRELSIPTATGVVKLKELAEIKRESTVQQVSTSNGERIATVSLTPAENQLRAVSTEVTKRLADLELPQGASAELGGAATEQAESFGQLFLALLAAIAIVYVIMVATFKSLIQPLILLVSIPFAATGAIGLLLLTGTPLGLPSLIGMLMLVGIVVTNAIVLIDLINQYRLPSAERPALSLNDAIMHGARQRLRPILMTAAATIFALIPMGLGITGQSGFISQPLAIVVIGGLFSSTLLTLILVPVLYRLIEGRKERTATKRAAKREANAHHSATSAQSAAETGTAITDSAGTPATKATPATESTAPTAQATPAATSTHTVDGHPVIVDPMTGQIPLTRRQRKEIEKSLNTEHEDL